MSLTMSQVKHNLSFANVSMSNTKLQKLQKEHAKEMDKKFSVKIEFLSGIYDDEYKIIGKEADVRRARDFISK